MKHVERNLEILTAASKLFTEKGYDQVKYSDIDAVMQKKEGYTYLFYVSKKELYHACIQFMAEEAEKDRLAS